MYLLNANEIKEVEEATFKSQSITSLDLMEKAGSLCAEIIASQFDKEQTKIVLFCGIGNNGGDGLVMARILNKKGFQVSCYIVNFSSKRSKGFLENYNRLKDLGLWPVIINNKADFPVLDQGSLVIDAILGVGINRTPSELLSTIIEYLNKSETIIIAIDTPSGLFSNSPVLDTQSAIKATYTLSFNAPKLSFLLPDNKDYITNWEILDIGLDQNAIEKIGSSIQLVTEPQIKSYYKKRNPWSHKGSYGHSLLIGGSYGKIGALCLATKAALKTGCGYASAHIPACGYLALQNSVQEAMVTTENDPFLSLNTIDCKNKTVGIGPGLGTHPETQKGFYKLLKEIDNPMVLDADAINLIAKDSSILKEVPKGSILTPHPKELERLLGGWDDDYQKIEKIKKICKTYQVIIVLKGRFTLITNGDSIFFNTTGNSALATSGSGDVLTGIITSLLAQTYTPFEAAIFGVYLHGLTASIGGIEIGEECFMASDIIRYLPKAFAIIKNKKQDTDE